jgi:hypothetical protein
MSKVTPNPDKDQKFESNLGEQSGIGFDNSSVLSKHIGEGEVTPQKIAKVDGYTVPVVIEFDVTADASSGIKIFDANLPDKIEIVDVVIKCKATSAGGTLKITDGTNDISNAVVCATDDAVTRAGSIADAYATLSEGATLSVVAAQAADRGKIFIYATRQA